MEGERRCGASRVDRSRGQGRGAAASVDPEPEQLLAPEPADPEHDDQEQAAGRREALDLTAVRVLRESRTDAEALDLTVERLRHLGEVFTAAADRARTTMNRYARRDDAETPHPVRPDDQQAHRPQEPGPHCGREAGH
ncbi:hypothetical protein [Streptomyces syringium]|uniref:hypothetical protein n=1 Tax=Streptomyces syringium TaxID=76729 RepID=UPI0037CFBD51